jgi:hypothetical protein
MPHRFDASTKYLLEAHLADWLPILNLPEARIPDMLILRGRRNLRSQYKAMLLKSARRTAQRLHPSLSPTRQRGCDGNPRWRIGLRCCAYAHRGTV